MNDIKGVAGGTDQTQASRVRSFVRVHFLLFGGLKMPQKFRLFAHSANRGWMDAKYLGINL